MLELCDDTEYWSSEEGWCFRCNTFDNDLDIDGVCYACRLQKEVKLEEESNCENLLREKHPP